MGRRLFSREFKPEAIRLVKERGVLIVQASRDLEICENVLRRGVVAWTVELARYPGLTSRISSGERRRACRS